MKSATAIIAFVLAALLVTTAAAHHRPDHGGGGGPGAGLSLAAAPERTVYRAPTTLSGRLSGQNAAGQAVVLERDRWPFEGRYVNAAAANTDAQRRFSFTARPPANTRYRVRRGGVLSPIVTVGVRIRVSRRVSDSTPQRGELIRFRGRACPQHDGARVGIQRYNRALRRWRTVRTTRLRHIDGSSCSRYRRRFRVYRDGTYRVKVRTPHGDHLNGYSRRKRIDVHS